MRISWDVTVIRFLCNSSRSILILHYIVFLSKTLLLTEIINVLVDLGNSFQLLRLTCLIHLAWHSLHALSLRLFSRLLLPSAIWTWLILVRLYVTLFWNLITHQIGVFIRTRGFRLLFRIQSESKLFAAFLILGSLRYARSVRSYFLTFQVVVHAFRVSGRRTNHVSYDNRVDILNLSYFNFLYSVVPRLTSVPRVWAISSTTLTQ